MLSVYYHVSFASAGDFSITCPLKSKRTYLSLLPQFRKNPATEQCDNLKRHGSGAGKLRYIAGYVVAKTVFSSKQVVSNHMNGINNINVRKHLARISIQDHMSNTGQDSNFSETLAEIIDHLYVNSGTSAGLSLVFPENYATDFSQLSPFSSLYHSLALYL